MALILEVIGSNIIYFKIIMTMTKWNKNWGLAQTLLDCYYDSKRPKTLRV